MSKRQKKNNNINGINTFPQKLPDSNYNLTKIFENNQYTLCEVSDMYNTIAKIRKNTPENEILVKKEAKIWDIVSSHNICSKIFMTYYDKDYIYMIYEKPRGKSLKELYGKFIPKSIYKAIKQILWMLYASGVEYSEIIPENFYISDANVLYIINFENAKIIESFENYKMNDFLHEFLFSDLYSWNPHYLVQTKDEILEVQDEFDKKYMYVPNELKKYMKKNNDKIIISREHNFKPTGPFENVIVPQLQMYQDLRINKYFNYDINNKKDEKNINLDFKINNKENIFDKSIKIPFNESYYSYVSKYDNYNPYIEQFNKLSNQTVNSIDNLDEEIKQFQEMVKAVQDGTYYENLEKDKKELEYKKKLDKEERDKLIKEQLEIKKQVKELVKKHEKEIKLKKNEEKKIKKNSPKYTNA